MSLCLLSFVFSSIILAKSQKILSTVYNSTGEYWFVTTTDAGSYLECNHTELCYISIDASQSFVFSALRSSNSISATKHLILNCNADHSCYSFDIKPYNIKPFQLVTINCLYKDACRLSDFDLTDTPNVNITCNGRYACPSTVVSGNQSININCESSDSCASTWFQSSNTPNINMYCSSYSCDYARIYAQNSSNLNINCDGSESCRGMRIYCPSYIENSCIVRCDGRDSCEGVDFYFENDYTLNMINLTCIDGSDYACTGVTFDCGGIVVNSLDKEYKICNYYECCPFINKDDWLLDNCVSNQDCFINCTSIPNTTMIISQCGYRHINASVSNNLYITCPDSLSCSNIDVLCPVNGECNINCQYVNTGDWTINYQCTYGNIDATLSSALTLNCTHDYSCSYMDVSCPINGDCNILCKYSNWDNQCRQMNIKYDTNDSLHGIPVNNTSYQRNLKLICNGADSFYDNCWKVNVNSNGLSLNNVDIFCGSKSACSGNVFYLSDINDINLYCVGCSNTIIYSNFIENTYIYCSKMITNSEGCQYLLFNNQQLNNGNIHCEGTDSCKHSIFNILNTNNVSFTCSSGLLNDCNNVLINTSYISSSLTVNCINSLSCNNLEIYIPSNMVNIMNLNCLNGTNSCSNTTIFIDYDDFIQDFINIQCFNELSCNNGIHLNCLDNIVNNSEEITTIIYKNNNYFCSNLLCCPFNTQSPTSPTHQPTYNPTIYPTIDTQSPTSQTKYPTYNPTLDPTPLYLTIATLTPNLYPTSTTPNPSPTSSPIYSTIIVFSTKEESSNTTIIIIIIIIIILVILLVLISIFFYLNSKNKIKKNTPQQQIRELPTQKQVLQQRKLNQIQYHQPVASVPVVQMQPVQYQYIQNVPIPNAPELGESEGDHVNDNNIIKSEGMTNC